MASPPTMTEASSAIAAPEKKRRHKLQRSLTAATGLPRLDHLQQQRHHDRGHHHHHSHRKDRDERSSLLSPPTAVPSGRASADMIRPEMHSYWSELDPSRRTSLVVPFGDSLSKRGSRAETERSALLIQERADAIGRAADLKDSLAKLSTFSNQTSKNLDDSYYSVLERLGTLQSTIVAMKELASLSSELSHSFRADAQELVQEVENQVQPYTEIDEHQERIASLQARIEVGRDKAQGLSERVDKVRQRVEGWEAADKSWRERTRKRLKVIWAVIVTAAILLLILALLGSHQNKVTEAASALSSTIVEKASDLSSSALAPKRSSGSGPGTLSEALMAEGIEPQKDETDSLVDQVRDALRARHQEDRQGPDVLRVLDEL